MSRFQLNNIARYVHSSSTPVWIIVAVLGSLMLWLCWTTAYNMLSGDDMVFERTYTSLSTLIDSPVENYLTWTARLSNIFTLNIIFALTSEEFLEKFTLIFSIGVLLISTAKLLSSLFALLKLPNHTLKAYVISLATTLSLCIYSVTIYENFYWMAGVVTYVLPLAGLNFIAAYLLNLLRKPARPYHFVVLFLASLFVGLFNEAFVIQTISLSVLSVIFTWLLYKKMIIKYLPLVTSAILGFVASAVIMKFSPGTIYRTELNASLAPDNYDHSFGSIIAMASTTTVEEINIFISNNAYGLLLVSLVTILCAQAISKQAFINIHSGRIIAIALYAIALPVAAFYLLSLSVHYAYQPSITAYSLLTANYFAYVGIITFWICICRITPQIKTYRLNIASYSIVGLIMLVLLPAGMKITQIYDSSKKQRLESSETNELILSAIHDGKQKVSIGTSERYFTYCMPEPNPEVWCNKAYSRYYNIDVRADQFIDHYGNSRKRGE